VRDVVKFFGGDIFFLFPPQDRHPCKHLGKLPCHFDPSLSAQNQFTSLHYLYKHSPIGRQLTRTLSWGSTPTYAENLLIWSSFPESLKVSEKFQKPFSPLETWANLVPPVKLGALKCVFPFSLDLHKALYQPKFTLPSHSPHEPLILYSNIFRS